MSNLPKELPLFIKATASQYACEGEFMELPILTEEDLVQSVAEMVWQEAIAIANSGRIFE